MLSDNEDFWKRKRLFKREIALFIILHLDPKISNISMRTLNLEFTSSDRLFWNKPKLDNNEIKLMKLETSPLLVLLLELWLKFIGVCFSVLNGVLEQFLSPVMCALEI